MPYPFGRDDTSFITLCTRSQIASKSGRYRWLLLPILHHLLNNGWTEESARIACSQPVSALLFAKPSEIGTQDVCVYVCVCVHMW